MSDRTTTWLTVALMLALVPGTASCGPAGEPSIRARSPRPNPTRASNATGATPKARPGSATPRGPRQKVSKSNPDWLFGIEVDGKCGFINHKGKVVIPPKLRIRGCLWKGFSRKGLLLIRRHRRWSEVGYMDGKGQMKIPFARRRGGAFSSGLAPVMKLPKLRKRRRRPRRYWGWYRRTMRRKPKLWGYMNRDAKLVIPSRFRCASSFSEGLAAVCIGRKMGYIDTKGKLVIPARYKRAHAFHGGVAVVETPVGKGVIDKRGRYVQKPRGRDKIRLLHSRFFGGMAKVLSPGRHTRCGYMDLRGRIVVKPKYQWLYCRPFSEGLASVRILKKVGYIDAKGRLVIKPRFDAGRQFSGGLAPVALGRRWGFINRRGTLVLPTIYTNAHRFRHGLAAVSIESQWRYIDRRGKTVWRTPSPKVAGKALAAETIARGGQSKHKKPTFQTITSRRGFGRLWRRLWNRRFGRRWGRRRYGGPPLPKIDFRKRTVLAAFQGRMGSTSSGIQIKRVVDSKHEVVVFVTLAKPIAGCMAGAAITSPWHIIAIPRRKKPHRFVVSVVDACTWRAR